MARPIQKKQKMGYVLKINRTGEAGSQNWTQVGYLFVSKHEALTYKQRHHKEVGKYTVTGIRFNVEPVHTFERK